MDKHMLSVFYLMQNDILGYIVPVSHNMTIFLRVKPYNCINTVVIFM